MKQLTIQVAKLAPNIIYVAEGFMQLLPVVTTVGNALLTLVLLPFKGIGYALDYAAIGLIRFQEKLGNISSQVAEEQIRLMGEQATKSTQEINNLNKAMSKTGGAGQTPATNPNAALPTLAKMAANKSDISEAEKAQKQMDNKAQQIFDQTRTPVEQYQTKLDELNKMLNDGSLDWDTYNRAVMQASTGLDDHIGVIDGAKSVMDGFLKGQIHSWGDLGKAGMKALDDIMGNMLKMTLSGGGGGIGGIVSSIFGNAASGGTTGGLGASVGGLLAKAGSSIAGTFGGGFGGFFAEGGNFSGGKPIVVGERGPELIVPRHGGTVIPNEQGKSGGRPIQVNFHISTPNVEGFKLSQGQIAAQAAMAIRGAGRNL